MPHLTVEYSANVKDAFDISTALRAANAAMLASGPFEPEQVKSRACLLESFRVGNADSGEAFVHARIHVVAGRSLEIRQALGDKVLAALQSALKPTPGLRVQFTAEVNETEAATYQKIVIQD